MERPPSARPSLIYRLLHGPASQIEAAGTFGEISDDENRASARERAFAADLVGLVMTVTGKAISSQARCRAEVDELAQAIGEMFCAYLKADGAVRPLTDARSS